MSDRPLNWNSQNVTRGWQKGVTAFFYGLGFTQEDFDRPQVGIGIPLLEGNLCNVHAAELAALVKEGCKDAGLIGFGFGTPGISDNITQGHEGGNASLPSRNVIANSAELVCTGHCYDAMIGLHHCDKNGPGFAMALARMNYPGLILSGGSILPGCHAGKSISILDVYDSQAGRAVGVVSEEDAEAILRTACPGPGGCGIAASFNTWGIAMEAIGLMPPNSSSNPAVSQEKRDECRTAGALVRRLLEMDLRPRDILTVEAFENALRAIAAAGGSTNGILHLLALAREAGVPFGMAEMQPILRETPVYCNFAPRGRGTMADLFELGGTNALLKRLLQVGLLHGECMTVTGKTMAENVADAADIPDDQSLVAPAGKPFKDFADIQIAFGNVAPEGLVLKVSNNLDVNFRGKAICFEDTRSVAVAAEEGRIRPGHVIVLRYLGPVASGMPEALVASAALGVPELEGKVALLSDTRVSGVSHGAIGVHCSPEAAVGGPIAWVHDGDEIEFDLSQGRIRWHVDHYELDRRMRDEPIKPIRHLRGYLSDFAAVVSQASDGCVSKSRLEPEPINAPSPAVEPGTKVES